MRFKCVSVIVRARPEWNNPDSTKPLCWIFVLIACFFFILDTCRHCGLHITVGIRHSALPNTVYLNCFQNALVRFGRIACDDSYRTFRMCKRSRWFTRTRTRAVYYDTKTITTSTKIRGLIRKTRLVSLRTLWLKS